MHAAAGKKQLCTGDGVRARCPQALPDAQMACAVAVQACAGVVAEQRALLKARQQAAAAAAVAVAVAAVPPCCTANEWIEEHQEGEDEGVANAVAPV